MRNKKLELKDKGEIVALMERCQVCRLALNDGDYPYIVPMSFGVEAAEGGMYLYFHGATVGKRFDLIAKNNKAGFEMDLNYRLLSGEKACKSNVEYESVIGCGEIEIVPDEEKKRAFDILMRHYAGEKEFVYGAAALKKTAAFRLTVKEVTGKRNLK